jgi:F0F1-type ATP synthase gamma subunit
MFFIGFSKSKEEMILTLIPKSLKTQLYKGIRDSFASEHDARMTAFSINKTPKNGSKIIFLSRFGIIKTK